MRYSFSTYDSLTLHIKKSQTPRANSGGDVFRPHFRNSHSKIKGSVRRGIVSKLMYIVAVDPNPKSHDRDPQAPTSILTFLPKKHLQTREPFLPSLPYFINIRPFLSFLSQLLVVTQSSILHHHQPTWSTLLHTAVPLMSTPLELPSWGTRRPSPSARRPWIPKSLEALGEYLLGSLMLCPLTASSLEGLAR